MDDVVAQVRAGYDVVAPDYARLVSGLGGESDLERAVLATFVRLVREAGGPGAAVADVGCGTGRLTAHLHDAGLAAVGVDPSSGMLAQARRAHPDLPFRTGSLTAVDLPDGSCAGVLAWYCLQHLRPEHRPAALVELVRLLRPGGVLLLGIHVGTGHRVSSGAYGPPVDLDAWDLTLAEAVDLVEGAGLVVHTRLQRAPLGPERRDQASLLCRRPPAS